MNPIETEIRNLIKKIRVQESLRQDAITHGNRVLSELWDESIGELTDKLVEKSWDLK